MLILTRQVGERIRIGDDVTVMVTRIHEGHISLGIEAPRGTPVHRAEVFKRIHDEKINLDPAQ